MCKLGELQPSVQEKQNTMNQGEILLLTLWHFCSKFRKHWGPSFSFTFVLHQRTKDNKYEGEVLRSRTRRPGGRTVYAACSLEPGKRIKGSEYGPLRPFQHCIIINKAGRGAPHPHPVDAWLDSPYLPKKILGVIKASTAQPDGYLSPLLTLVFGLPAPINVQPG